MHPDELIEELQSLPVDVVNCFLASALQRRPYRIDYLQLVRFVGSVDIVLKLNSGHLFLGLDLGIFSMEDVLRARWNEQIKHTFFSPEYKAIRPQKLYRKGWQNTMYLLYTDADIAKALIDRKLCRNDLMKIIENDDLPALKEIIRTQTFDLDQNIDPQIDCLLLNYAASVNSFNIFHFLLLNSAYKPSLAHAVQGGNEEIIQLALEANQEYIEQDSLIAAARYGHESIVRWLVDTHDMKITVETVRSAVEFGCLNTLMTLFELADEETIAELIHNSDTVIHAAVSFGQSECLRYLLEKGFKFENCCDYQGSILVSALHKGHDSISSILLQAWARFVGSSWEPCNALVLAAKRGMFAVVKNMVEIGKVNVNPIAPHNKSPLGAALKNRYVEIARYLIEHGAKLSCKGNGSSLPLIQAVSGGSIDCVKLVLETNPKLKLKDKNGRTALHYAAYRGNIDIVKLLAESGAPVNITDNNKFKPVHMAACQQHRDVVQYLLGAGTDLEHISNVKYASAAERDMVNAIIAEACS